MKYQNKLVLLTAALFVGLPAFAKLPVDVSMPHEAKPGETVTVSVTTDADAKCKIEAQDAGVTQSLKLMDKNADKSGKTSWSFEIPKNFKANEMPIIITVSKNGQEEKSSKAIMIKK